MKRAPQDNSTGTVLRSMTRLLIGGVEVGLGKLLSGLERVDEELTAREMPPRDASSLPVPGTAAGAAGTESTAGAADSVEAEAEEGSTESSLVGEALVGLFFELQDGLLRGIDVLERTNRAASRLSEPLLRPLQQSRLLSPLRQRVDRLAERGEAEIMHLVERGRQESNQGRKLVTTVISGTVDQGIEYVAASPEVQELVQEQSTGLANEMLEEVRERTVSADNYLEGIARRMLRKSPRQQLPAPPVEVIEQAASIQSQKGKRAPRQ